MDIKTLLGQLAEYYCVPRARGSGRKVVGPRTRRPDAPGPVVDELRCRAIACDGQADRLAVLAFFDPPQRAELMATIAEEWGLHRDLPDAEWILRDWVERYPDDPAMLGALPDLCGFLARVGRDFEQATRFTYTCQGLASVLGRLADHHPNEVAPLLDLMVRLEPDRRQSDVHWLWEGPAFEYFSRIVGAVAPVLFEHGSLSESQVQSLVRRYRRLADVRPDLTCWQRWVQKNEWEESYSLGRGQRVGPPSGGVQRLVALCTESNLLCDLLLSTLPDPNPQDLKNAALLQSIPEDNALNASISAPAWAGLMEQALAWPGLAALSGLLAVFQEPFSDWRAQMQGLERWRGGTDIASLRRHLTRLSPARVKLIKTGYPHYQGWYWADAVLGKAAQAVLKDVQHGRSRGFLALALVPRQPNCRAYVSAVEAFVATLPSRSDAVRQRVLELARFALRWLEPDRVLDGDWESLRCEFVEQLEGG